MKLKVLGLYIQRKYEEGYYMVLSNEEFSQDEAYEYHEKWYKKHNDLPDVQWEKSGNR